MFCIMKVPKLYWNKEDMFLSAHCDNKSQLPCKPRTWHDMYRRLEPNQDTKPVAGRADAGRKTQVNKVSAFGIGFDSFDLLNS